MKRFLSKRIIAFQESGIINIDLNDCEEVSDSKIIDALASTQNVKLVIEAGDKQYFIRADAILD